MEQPTIKIKSGADYAVINAEDFAPELHVKWTEPKRRAKKEKAADAE